jgi:hypothetical protein
MSRAEKLSRRKVLTVAATGLTTVLAGCSSVLLSEEDQPAKEPPDPEIVTATADVGNFRQTQSQSKTLILLKNNGGLGEFNVTVRARGEVAVYTEASNVFSLENEQEYQMGFNLFTHEGAEEIEIEVKPTNYPNRKITHVISEEDTPDQVNYEGS